MKVINGNFAYKGIATLQHEDAGIVFKKLFEAINPSQILEIGTAYGGLSLLLRDILNEIGLYDTEIKTYDVDRPPNTFQTGMDYAAKNNLKIDFRLKNIFDGLESYLVEVDETTNYIQQTGRTIVLCDGGKKIDEVRILSKLLKPNDIIMAHDYARNEEIFENVFKDKIWNWLAIQDSDVQEIINENNLQPYMKEEFEKVVWWCVIKI